MSERGASRDWVQGKGCEKADPDQGDAFVAAAVMLFMQHRLSPLMLAAGGVNLIQYQLLRAAGQRRPDHFRGEPGQPRSPGLHRHARH